LRNRERCNGTEGSGQGAFSDDNILQISPRAVLFYFLRVQVMHFELVAQTDEHRFEVDAVSFPQLVE